MDQILSSLSSSSSSTSIGLFSAVSLVTLYFNSLHHKKVANKKRMEEEHTWYTGSCHCYAVNFKLKAPKHLVVWDCNCSICHMKKNAHFIIPAQDFHLSPESEDAITTYSFNTKVAKHKFCKHCGVQAFYHPRSNPDGIAVTLACIPSDQVLSLLLSFLY